MIVGFAAFCVAWAAAQALECEQFDSHMGATFDLRDLKRIGGQPSYTVSDGDIPCTSYVEKNYTYYFNICGTVSGYPPACSTLSGITASGALQVDNRANSDPSDDWCYLVGAYDMKTSLNLLNKEDPTKGLQLTYYGDYCANLKQRMFQINLECQDKMNPIALHALELEHCVYTVSLPSVYGCPLECPVGGVSRSLCGGNGYCAYDSDKSSARCFCNRGFEGVDCTTTTSTAPPPLNYSPALLGLIVTIFVIIGVLGASIVLMIRQMAAYKDDIANYQVLKGGEDESTTV